MASSPPINYTVLNDGIHEIKMLEISNHAVDMWMAQTLTIFETTEIEQMPILILLDHSIGMQALKYGFDKARETTETLKQYKDTHVAMVAFIYEDEGFLLSMISNMVRIITRNQNVVWRFFPNAKRESAIEWLLEQKRKKS